MTGVPPIQRTNLLNRRRSGCLPTRNLLRGNCFPIRMKNHRCAREQEQREPAEELRRGQKLLPAPAEPLANLARPAWLEYESKLLLEPQHHCAGC